MSGKCDTFWINAMLRQASCAEHEVQWYGGRELPTECPVSVARREAWEEAALENAVLALWTCGVLPLEEENARFRAALQVATEALEELDESAQRAGDGFCDFHLGDVETVARRALARIRELQRGSDE